MYGIVIKPKLHKEKLTSFFDRASFSAQISLFEPSWQ